MGVVSIGPKKEKSSSAERKKGRTEKGRTLLSKDWWSFGSREKSNLFRIVRGRKERCTHHGANDNYFGWASQIPGRGEKVPLRHAHFGGKERKNETSEKKEKINPEGRKSSPIGLANLGIVHRLQILGR